MSGVLSRGLAVAAAALLFSFATLAGSAEAKSRPLFGEEPARAVLAAPAVPGGSHRRPEVRGRRVKVDISAVAGVDLPDGADAIELNLFADEKFEAVKSRFQRRGDKHFTWSGKVSDDPGSTVVLVAGDGQMQGHVFAHGKFFSIRGADAASQEVVEIDQSAFPQENCGQAPAGDAAQTAPAPTSSPDAAADTGATIDALVVYTPAAQRAAGGATAMLNLAQLAVDTTNASYANSFIPTRLDLVHAQKISYTESGDWDTDLDRLSGTSDGFMDNVHAFRETYRADVVILLVDNASACGMAYLSATPSTSFALVAWDCAVGSYSFGHEIGHLQGARHDLYVDNTPGYNHGDVDLGSRQRTIMAYNDQCAASGIFCTRVPYWSSPALYYPGTATKMGSKDRENNARVLSGSAYNLANFVLRTAQLTVQSAYPAAGVSITASVADIDGTSGGTTPFTLSYDPDTPVTLTAPATNAAGFSLLNWSGCPSPSGTSCAVTMGANATVTANYDTVPTLDAISKLTIDEDAPRQKVRLSGITAGGGQSQPLAVAAVSSNTGLIPNPVQVVYTSPGTTGNLRFTPVPDVFGTATITVTVSDGPLPINKFERYFVVKVRKVNDAPSFVKGAKQTVPENAGAQTVVDWATSISPGPPNESAQTLSFLTKNDNHGLFSVPPAVAADGTLTFTPAATAGGIARVTVKLRDSGGTANGGVDTSEPQTFSINVTAVAGLAALNPIFEGVIQTASTAAELQAALAAAGANGEHDIIRLAGGTYALSANAGEHFAYSSTEDRDLVIEGGWTPDFSQRADNIPTGIENDVPVTAAGSGGVLAIAAGGNVSLSGIAVSGGRTAGSGGGAHISAAGSIVVENCRILDNASGGEGGGLFLESSGGDVRLHGSTIRGNSGAGGGGGLIRALSVSVQGNEISGNAAAATDGGLQASVISGGSLIVSNNTIHGNQAPAGSSGLSVAATGTQGVSVLDVHNNIVYGNGAAPDFTVAPESDCDPGFLDLNIVNNDIAWYAMCRGSLLDGSNTSVDFSGRGAGTIRLAASDTALIDRGSPYTWPIEDIEGDTIPLAGPGGASAVSDIGADEYNPENIAGPASMSVAASGSVSAANGSATITVTLDAPAKRDLVLFLDSGDPAVVSLTTSYLRIPKGSSSEQTVVQAASGATGGASTITATDPSGWIAQGSVHVSVDIVE